MRHTLRVLDDVDVIRHCPGDYNHQCALHLGGGPPSCKTMWGMEKREIKVRRMDTVHGYSGGHLPTPSSPIFLSLYSCLCHLHLKPDSQEMNSSLFSRLRGFPKVSTGNSKEGTPSFLSPASEEETGALRSLEGLCCKRQRIKYLAQPRYCSNVVFTTSCGDRRENRQVRDKPKNKNSTHVILAFQRSGQRLANHTGVKWKAVDPYFYIL